MLPMAMALGGGALSIGGSVMSAFGGDKQAKAAREAAKQYIAYQERERQKFLDAGSPIRDKLMSYTDGKHGYDEELMRGMKDQVNENYGQSLADMTRLSAGSAVGKNTGGGNVYTPGRYDRAMRTMGQNLAANRANSIRDVNQKNADMAVSNQRFAVSALPTYMPGLSATPQIEYGAFQGANTVAPWENYAGDMMQSLGQPLMSAGADGLARGAIAERLARVQAQNNQQQNQPGPWQSYYTSPYLRY